MQIGDANDFERCHVPKSPQAKVFHDYAAVCNDETHYKEPQLEMALCLIRKTGTVTESRVRKPERRFGRVVVAY